MKVLRGTRNFKDVGKVLEFAGKPKMDIWPEDHCNEYNGTDSTIFAPLFGPDDDIVSFGYELCRSISAHFRHHSKVKGTYVKMTEGKKKKKKIALMHQIQSFIMRLKSEF